MERQLLGLDYIKMVKDYYPTKIFGDISEQVLLGINSDSIAYTFPQIIQLDLTNDCNLNCVGCWCHSDLMGEQKFKGNWKHKHLSRKIVFNLIRSAANNGTKEIQLSGSGDPMMYPHFMDVVRLIKKLGLILHIITNFTLVTKSIIQEFIKLKVDRITVSLWAGTPETYVKTHQNQSEKTFYRIKKNLEFLYNLKHQFVPKIKIYNVISNINYHEIEEMINFALDVMADFLEFQTIDIVKGKSDEIALTETHKESIREQFLNISKRIDLLEVPTNKRLSFYDKHNKKNEFVEFSRFIKRKSYYLGFKYYLEDITKYRVKCPVDRWHISVEEDNVLENCLKFKYDKSLCNKCHFISECSIDKERYLVKAEFLSLLGIGSFFRRISNIKGKSFQKYDVNIVDSIPCYIGWTFVRILPNGDVIPCCKAYKKPLGNLNEKNFSEIWLSKEYNEFRFLAKSKKKNHPYFKKIECYKSCDNVGMNLETYSKVKYSN